jgi:hypothetical protein
MTRSLWFGAALALGLVAAACDDGPIIPPNDLLAADSGGGGQTDTVGRVLAAPFRVHVSDDQGPRADVTVEWSILQGGGSVPATSVTNSAGIATATLTLGTAAGLQAVQATVAGADGSPVVFTATALPDQATQITITGGNGQTGCVSQRLASPLSVVVRDQFNNGIPALPVAWHVVTGGGSPADDTTETNGAGVATLTFTLGATPGANTLEATVEGVAAPAAFGLTGNEANGLVATVSIPANYGIHDTFVRDGLAFVFAWNTGLMIFDVGNGIRNGSACSPVYVGGVATVGGSAHNGWWFWNPVSSEKRYVFVGQEGPGTIGGGTTGDVHVVDVTNLTAPFEVATFHLNGAGAHNFWMDEPNQVLYAAFYNGGVVKLNVASPPALSGNLASRLVANVQPGGPPPNTFVWGVQYYPANGSLYVIDMISGLWQLNGGNLQTLGGGNNVPERYSSDLWVHGGYVYTGTWGNRGVPGNAVKIWQLNGSGAPVLVDSIITSGVGTVSDVEVSADGKMLLFSAEGGTTLTRGVYLYNLANPASPAFIAQFQVNSGVHTATFGYVNGRVLVFGAKNPAVGIQPALLIYDVTSLVP